MTIHSPSLVSASLPPTPTLSQILALAPYSTINRIWVTPSLAAELIPIDTKNRKISPVRVAGYADDMRRGNWKFNGTTMGIRKDGILADSGHRIRACIQAGVPYETILVTGIEPEAVATIDRGRPRSISDDLKMSDEKHAASLGAAMRNLWIFAKWDLAAVFSSTEANLLLQRRPTIRDSVHKATRVKVLPPSMVAALHYIGTRVQGKAAEADAFINVLSSGIPFYDGDPAQMVRERFLRQQAQKNRVNHSVKYKLLAHTWNLFSERTSVQKVVTPQEVRIDRWDIAEFYKSE